MYGSTIRVVLAAASLLLIPMLAMQFTDQVAWGPGDFGIAGALLVGAGLMFVLATRKASHVAYRAGLGVALATMFFLVWTNLAVGIIGSEDNPANLMYLGVIAVGFIGAIVSRFEPHKMALAMFATALAQALVAAIALIAGQHRSPGSSVVEILWLNAAFIALFVVAALLFRAAARARRFTAAPQRQ